MDEPGVLTLEDRDQLVALKKADYAEKAAVETGVTERQVRRLLRELRNKGDASIQVKT